ncbi:MAG: ABC transporter permease subunit [Planctomycetes bacterium]|nr:ABC transporter permease subunit [Planctomycetota bacterium]
MIWKIAKKEFLLNLMTFKFAVGTILCVVLMAVFVPILMKDYEQRLQKYNKLVANNEAELRKVRVYKNITPTIFRPPSVLSVFSAGLEKRLGDSTRIELESIPKVNATPTGDNHYLSIFPVLDASLILKVVLSLLAILIAYDRISGEKEHGTLRLILANRTARHEVLLGKLLAGIVTLAVPATIAFVVGLLVVELSPMADLGRSDWIRIGLIYLASLIFISAMYNIGLLFSCLANRSAISLILGLFFWVMCVVVIPNASAYMATRIRLLEPKEKTDDQIASLRSECERQTRGWSGSISDTKGAFGHVYVRGCNTEFFEFQEKAYPVREPLKIKYAARIWEVEHGYLKTVWIQRQLANNLSRISPIFSYENVTSILAGTDLASFQYSVTRAKAYRNQIVEYIRSKTNNFSSPSYFTTCSREDVLEYENDWGAKRRRDEKTFDPPLNLEDLPSCIYRLDLAESVQRAIPDLALLILANVLFFALSFVAFMRCDVR